MVPRSTDVLPTVSPPHQSIALAIAILKTKPIGVAARDYVLQLRASLKSGDFNISEPEWGCYLDLVKYWQQRCRDAELKCDALVNQNIQLERTNSLLQQRDQGDQVNDVTKNATKRKKTAATPRQPQRTRASKAKAATMEQMLEEEFEVLDPIGEDGTDLALQMWTIQKLFRQPGADSDSLCSALVKTTRAIGRILPTIARCHDRLTSRSRERTNVLAVDQDRTEFACSLAACARAFGMVLVGLNTFDNENSSRRLPGLVIYECVQMFSHALDAIQIGARRAAEGQLAENGTNAASIDSKESAAARGIAHFLTGLMAYLEKGHSSHQELFDGFTFVLFERVGTRLYYCTFGHHRSSTIEGGITLPQLSSDGGKPSHQALEALAIKFEVKALNLVLCRAMGLAPNHMNPQAPKKNITKLSRSLSLKNLSASKTRLSPLAKDRLQRTLITCMFGEKVDDDFMDILSMPVRFGPLPNVPSMEDKDVNEWYLSSVWKLVGWDILARESKWPQ